MSTEPNFDHLTDVEMLNCLERDARWLKITATLTLLCILGAIWIDVRFLLTGTLPALAVSWFGFASYTNGQEMLRRRRRTRGNPRNGPT